MDNEYCSFNIKEIEEDNFWEYGLKAELENKSAEATYMFSITEAYINGILCNPLFASEVAPGKKSNETITFSLEDEGMDKVTDIELHIRVYDYDNWADDAVAEEVVHVYPYGEDKAELYTRETKSSDTVLVDNDSITVIITDFDEDGIFGYTANLFIVNKTSQNLMYAVDDCSINGYMIDPFFATSIGADKCEFTSMSWLDDELEENDIEEVETIEFELRVYDDDNWTADNLFDQVITVQP